MRQTNIMSIIGLWILLLWIALFVNFITIGSWGPDGNGRIAVFSLVWWLWAIALWGLIWIIGIIYSSLNRNKDSDSIIIDNNTNHTFFPKKAINTGWKATKKYFWILMLVGGIAYIPSLVSILFDATLPHIPGATITSIDPLTNLPSVQPQGIRVIVVAIVSIITGVVGARLGIGLTKTNLMILEDKKPTVKDLFVPLQYLLRFSIVFIPIIILSTILYLLWTYTWPALSSILIIIIIVSIIPGIYIVTRLSFFQYFIAEWYGAIDAIKASWAITEGNVWNLIGISFVYFGIAVLWVLALGFWLLWAIPTIMLAQAYIYTQLKRNLPTHFKPLH